MEYNILSQFVIFGTLLVALNIKCHKLTIEQFTWKLIENSLNSTKSSENFVVAPYEAYELYKEIFEIENQKTNEIDAHKVNELTTVMPAIRKQQTIMAANRTKNLLSSISLTARWSFNFQTRDTHKRVFNQHGQSTQKMWVDFLRKDDTFYYAHDEQLNASILELPLNVKEIKLKLILPDQWEALSQLKEYMLQNIDEFRDLNKKTNKMTLVRVLLPKFHITYKKYLIDFLEEISAKEVEDYENIYQLSNLEFNERGIGRFERTTVLFWNAYSYLRVTPKVFDINHPFLFLISNKDGIQFFGQVVKMQQ